MSRTLVITGDSVTDCGRTKERDITANVSGRFSAGYPGLIASKLLGEQPEVGWEIYNMGISGNRVVDLYARWKIDCLNLHPDIISILIGVNDTWHEYSHGNGVDLKRYEQFYRMILDWSLEANPKVKFMLLEPFAMFFGAVPEQAFVDEVSQRAAIVRKLVEDYKANAVLVPLETAFQEATRKAPPEYWLKDGVHPLAPGHQVIANAWFEALKKL